MVQITAAMTSCGVYHIYPDPGQVHLRADIAAFLDTPGVSADNVCCGCGSDEILDLVLRLFEPAGLVNLPPTFAMYPFLAKIAKVPVVTVDRTPPPHFALDFDAIEAAVAAGANLIFVASPNNPTGGMLTHAEVGRLTALNAIVVVDEAYAEFAPRGSSAVSLVPTTGNLIVLRTFSKWAGLAGLRVGYSVSHASVNAAFMGIKQPYNVNVAADTAARAALAHSGDIMTLQVGPLVRERDAMIAALTALGWLIPIPTVSNFVLLEVSRRAWVGGGEGRGGEGVRWLLPRRHSQVSRLWHHIAGFACPVLPHVSAGAPTLCGQRDRGVAPQARRAGAVLPAWSAGRVHSYLGGATTGHGSPDGCTAGHPGRADSRAREATDVGWVQRWACRW